MLFDDDVYDAICYIHVNFMNGYVKCNALLCGCKLYECLNVIDDDVYAATHCENVN
jgi:hypothetical protein